MRAFFRSGTFPAALLLLTLAATPPDARVADAAERQDLEQVRSLLRQGADVNAAQADGMTALHWMALNGSEEIGRVLLYAGAHVEPTTRVGGYTPLHLATRRGHGEVVGLLLEAGADPDRKTTTGATALHFAAEADDAEAIRLLAEHGAEVDARDTFLERTPVMFAAVIGAVAAVDALIEVGADLSATTRVRDYVEISSDAREDRRRRERIKEAAEEPEEEDEEDEEEEARGQPPQQQAAARRPGAPAEPPDSAEAEVPDSAEAPDSAQAEAPDSAEAEPPDSVQAGPEEREEEADEEELEEEPEEEPAPPEVWRGGPRLESLSSTEQIGKQGGFTALHYAVRDGQIDAARRLLDAGTDIDRVTAGDGSSPLLVAVINGNYDLARELLARGADPNLTSDDGAGPLFATLNIQWSLRTWYPQPAAFRGQATSYLDLMELLLQAGADPNQRLTTHIWYAAYNAGRMGVDFTGATPFWRAAYAADVRAMKLLVEYGADPAISTYHFAREERGDDDDDEDGEPELDPSGQPPMQLGGPAVHPIHAASGVGFGTSRVAQQHRSAPGGWLASMKYLVGELGFDPNMRDEDGYTPVHHAAARGDSETIRYLVSQGADVTLLSRRGQTTADMANSPEQRAQPHPATVALLEKLGSKNNHQCRSCGGS